MEKCGALQRNTLTDIILAIFASFYRLVWISRIASEEHISVDLEFGDLRGLNFTEQKRCVSVNFILHVIQHNITSPGLISN